MGGWVKVALGVLVAALVAVLIVSFTSGDDSTSPTEATVAAGQPAGSAGADGGGKKGATGNSKAGGAKSDGAAGAAAPIEEEPGFTGSGGSEGGSGGSNPSGGSGSKGSGKVGGSGATSPGSGKAKKKKKKKKKSQAASQAPKLDPETAAASAVLEAYMSARGAQDWSTACAQLAPKGIGSLERFAGAGRGCVATFTAIYPHLEPGAWTNTMTGPIASLSADGVAIYHGTTGRDYAMPMVKEGGVWKVAALGPTAVS